MSARTAAARASDVRAPAPTRAPTRSRHGAVTRGAATRAAAARALPAPRQPARPARVRPGRGRPAPAQGARAAGLRASSGLLDRLLRGRGWVLCIGLLLVGIVFLNVRVLELDRSTTAAAERAKVLKRENAALRLRAAELGSSERIQAAAAEQGLVWPEPGRVRYLRSQTGVDARRAAAHVRGGRSAKVP